MADDLERANVVWLAWLSTCFVVCPSSCSSPTFVSAILRSSPCFLLRDGCGISACLKLTNSETNRQTPSRASIHTDVLREGLTSAAPCVNAAMKVIT